LSWRRGDAAFFRFSNKDTLMFDLFPGWTIEEILRLYESAFTVSMILSACFVVGLESTPVRAH
jgi:hypothetical protein